MLRRIEVDLENKLFIFEEQLDIPMDDPRVGSVLRYFNRIATKSWLKRNRVGQPGDRIYQLWISESNLPQDIRNTISKIVTWEYTFRNRKQEKELHTKTNIREYLENLHKRSNVTDIITLSEIKDLDPEEIISITIGGNIMQGKVQTINRALSIYMQNRIVEKTANVKVYNIKGTETEPYEITHDLTTDKWTCTCKNYTEAHKICKHIWACLMLEKPEMAEE
jgi:hypothetical protein